jgi:hypothetical protein
MRIEILQSALYGLAELRKYKIANWIGVYHGSATLTNFTLLYHDPLREQSGWFFSKFAIYYGSSAGDFSHDLWGRTYLVVDHYSHVFADTPGFISSDLIKQLPVNSSQIDRGRVMKLAAVGMEDNSVPFCPTGIRV